MSKKGVNKLNKGFGMIAILIGASCYGLVTPIVKTAYSAGYSYEQVTLNQYIVGALGFFLLVIWRGNFKFLNKMEILKIYLIGLIGLGGTSLFYYSSLKVLPASFSLILLFQFNWIGLLIERLILKKRISKNQYIAMILILIGTVIAINIVGIRWENFSLTGVVLGLLAALSYSIFLIGTSILNPKINIFVKNGIMVGGTLLTLAIAFLFYTPITELNPISGILKYGIFLGVLGNILAPFLISYGAPKVGGALTTLLSSIELPVGIFASILFLKEMSSYTQAFGIILILIGIYVSQINTHKFKKSVYVKNN